MSDETVPRLYGYLQWLMGAYGRGDELLIGQPREIVNLDDAEDALMYVAAAIDKARAGQLDPEGAVYAGAFLLLLWDHIKPLPPIDASPQGETMLVELLIDVREMLRRELRAPDSLPPDWS